MPAKTYRLLPVFVPSIIHNLTMAFTSCHDQGFKLLPSDGIESWHSNHAADTACWLLWTQLSLMNQKQRFNCHHLLGDHICYAPGAKAWHYAAEFNAICVAQLLLTPPRRFRLRFARIKLQTFTFLVPLIIHNLIPPMAFYKLSI